jgi:hypothetical protein
MVVEVAVAELGRSHDRIGGRFVRSEPRSRVREYVLGLTAGLERKNGWTLAGLAGEVSPDGMQRLLRRVDWDVDDTGFLKQGDRSAGRNGRTRAPPVARRTVRWARSWPTPRCAGTR